jgi:hypothetical protein
MSLQITPNVETPNFYNEIFALQNAKLKEQRDKDLAHQNALAEQNAKILSIDKGGIHPLITQNVVEPAITELYKQIAKNNQQYGTQSEIYNAPLITQFNNNLNGYKEFTKNLYKSFGEKNIDTYLRPQYQELVKAFEQSDFEKANQLTNGFTSNVPNIYGKQKDILKFEKEVNDASRVPTRVYTKQFIPASNRYIDEQSIINAVNPAMHRVNAKKMYEADPYLKEEYPDFEQLYNRIGISSPKIDYHIIPNPKTVNNNNNYFGSSAKFEPTIEPRIQSIVSKLANPSSLKNLQDTNPLTITDATGKVKLGTEVGKILPINTTYISIKNAQGEPKKVPINSLEIYPNSKIISYYAPNIDYDIEKQNHKQDPIKYPNQPLKIKRYDITPKNYASLFGEMIESSSLSSKQKEYNANLLDRFINSISQEDYNTANKVYNSNFNPIQPTKPSPQLTTQPMPTIGTVPPFKFKK